MYSQIESNKRKSVFLIVIFTIFLIVLGYVYSILSGDSSYAMVWFAIIISLISTAISYYKGDKIALWSAGAKPIEHNDNKYVYHLVENLCITSGMPIPMIYIIEETAINAFATGRKPELATIAVTRGAIDKLTNEELEGVIAHELSHIKNYDIRFMTLVAVMVGAVSIMANIFWRIRWIGGGKRDNNNGGGQMGMVLLVIGIAMAILSPIIAEMIKMAISRKREYLADAGGSLLTRYPEGLANALEKIKNESEGIAHPNRAIAHLYFSNPFRNHNFPNLFSSHPPIDERIKKLREMA